LVFKKRLYICREQKQKQLKQNIMKTFKKLDLQVKAMLIFTLIIGSLFTVMALTQGFNSF
jgi:hypothetical protein